MTNWVWSYRLKKNIGFALVSAQCPPREDVEGVVADRRISGRLTTLPFL